MDPFSSSSMNEEKGLSCEFPPIVFENDLTKPMHHPQNECPYNERSPQRRRDPFILDNIIVGYAFGPKKMETMALIMAEASKALSTVVTPTMEFCEESSMVTASESVEMGEKESATAAYYFPDDIDDQDARSFSSTRESSIASQRSQRGCGGVTGIQLTFLPDTIGFFKFAQTLSTEYAGDGDQSMTELSMTTAATTVATSSLNTSLALDMQQSQSSQNLKISQSQSVTNNEIRRYPIQVSFVPIDLDTPLEEQHGGKFDVILHKMTEDILCVSKMLRSMQISEGCAEINSNINGMYETRKHLGVNLIRTDTAVDGGVYSPPSLLNSTCMSRHHERAVRRIQRLQEYKQKIHPSCALVDSPTNILAVMSRADMAEVLSTCLNGVTTKKGIPVSTPRFRVVEEGDEAVAAFLASEMDAAGFHYPLIAKPLTAAGTKSSHHMGIVMARDGLQRLKTPCLLQEYANHGAQLFKVYVLGELVWVFSRESLPNLPEGENEMPLEKSCDERTITKSYVEFERPAGSRCYVEFNSQRPYPKLADFGINESFQKASNTESTSDERPTCNAGVSSNPQTSLLGSNTLKPHGNESVASYVTTDEIKPVTDILRSSFGLDLFGFDVLVKYDQKDRSDFCVSQDEVEQILVVDVNYFPGYKEVPHFPSLLAQYLTQKAVESRINVSQLDD